VNNKTLIIGAAAIGVGYFLYKKFVLDKTVSVDVVDIEPDPSGGADPKEIARRIEADRQYKLSLTKNNYSPWDGLKFFSKSPKNALLVKASDTTRFLDSFHQNVIDGSIVKIPYNTNMAFSALAALKTKSQFAWIAKAFETKYRITMKSYMKQYITDPITWNMFNTELDKKPQYTV
jgi:hypothetical protein